ncbi:MAG: hypothetical protein AAGA18_13735 [Verrucomicrobiota bacterium]
MLVLQDIIYSLEIGSLRQWIFRFTLLLVVGVIGGMYMLQFNSFSSKEAMDNAQLAKNIAQGKGYVTQVIRPVAIKQMQKAGTPDDEIDLFNFPETITPPLYPFVIGGIFKVLGTDFSYPADKINRYNGYVPEKVINFFNFSCVLVSVVVFYLWMVRAFDSRVAFVSATLFTLSGIVWEFASSGLNVCLILLLVTIVGFLLNEALQASELERPMLALGLMSVASIFVGLCFLTDYVFWVFALAFIVFSFLVFSENRFVIGGVVTVVVALVITPWLIRNMMVSGSPFGLSWIHIFADNGRVPGDAIWRSMGAEVSVASGLRPLIRAFVYGLEGKLSVLVGLLGSLVAVVFGLVSLFHCFKRPWARYSHWFFGVTFFLVLASNACVFRYHQQNTWMDNNLIVTLLPPILGFGTAFLYVLLDRLNIQTILTYPIILLVCLLQVFPMAAQLKDFGRKRTVLSANFPYIVPAILFSREWLEKDEVMVSDIPWATAWYQDRVSLWLPHKKEEELFEINSSIHELTSMLMTPYTSGKSLMEIRNGEYKEWEDLILLEKLNIRIMPFVTGLPKPDQYLYLTNKESIKRMWDGLK